MNQNKFSLDNLERTNSFRVPEGYFQQMSKEVMERVPKKQYSLNPIKRYRTVLLSAAASVCMALFGLSAYIYFTSHESQKEPEIASANAEDYIMMDNEAIYQYMSQD